MKIWAAGVLGAMLLGACSTPAGTTHAPPEAVLVDPSAAGWNKAALDEVVAYAQAQKTTGFLIIDNNRIITETNWPLPADAESATFKTNFVHGASRDGALIEDVASAQKSFIAFLAAIAIDRGKLDISKPVSAYLGPGWSKASAGQEAAITVRNLLEMSSGLDEKFVYEAPAGTKFFYNTPVYATMKPVLAKATGQTLEEISRDWLTAPLGMVDTSWAKRPATFADAGNPTGLATTPRDLARMGQLILDNGLAPDGKRVVSKAQLDALFVRSANNPAYGKLWWLNGGAYTLAAGPQIRRTEGSIIPAAPADLVAAQGAGDRKLYVVPSRKLLVVRTGQAAPDRDFNQRLWLRLMKAAPPR